MWSWSSLCLSQTLVFFAQIAGDREFVSWQPDLEESVKPSQQARPTVIRWADGGKEVFISGSFNNWSTKIPLIKRYLVPQVTLCPRLLHCRDCFPFSMLVAVPFAHLGSPELEGLSTNM